MLLKRTESDKKKKEKKKKYVELPTLEKVKKLAVRCQNLL